ncbi:DNA-binding domain-containing protein [Legionella fairfieldensis]|uniref:HvfC/BufC N-terminal domain-containing protein n=1 Tax=Legionella fairfieldensis TaxID=45064 RepID=UPI00048D66D3|nr:DNA-binding domain-containing protein [Legionella fairfieldensis]
MRGLLSLQHQFQDYLLNGQRNIEEDIVRSEKLSVDQRLGIYLDAYRCRLLDALAHNFPVLNTYLGGDEFQRLGNNYIDQYPSSYRSIRWYGDAFASYLCNDKTRPYLAELAEFEWKMTLAFDAADCEVLTIEQMATIPPESWATTRFIFHPSVQRMNFFWNSVELWQSISEKQTVLLPSPKSSLASWVLWRRDYINHFYTLVEEEVWALDTLIQGSTFAKLCAGLCKWLNEEDVGLRAASLLKGWIQSGLITAIK